MPAQAVGSLILGVPALRDDFDPQPLTLRRSATASDRDGLAVEPGGVLGAGARPAVVKVKSSCLATGSRAGRFIVRS